MNKGLNSNKNIPVIVKIIPLAIVSLVMGYFLFLIVKDHYKVLSVWTFLISLIVILWIAFIIKIFIESTTQEIKYPNLKEGLIGFGLLFLSAVMVHVLIYFVHLNSVLSAAIVSLIGGLFIKKYGADITVGAFFGMGLFMPETYHLFALAIIGVGILNYTLKPFFNGVGGKLGMTAFTGTFIIFIIFNQSFIESRFYNGFEILYVSLTAVVAAVLTDLLNNHFKLGPVTAYSAVSILGALLFIFFEPTKALGLAGVVFGASFVGMSSSEAHQNIFIVILAALLFSFVVIMNQNLDGLGGRFGTTALIGVGATQTILILYYYIKNKFITLKQRRK